MVQVASYAQVAADALAELSRSSEPGARLGSKDELRRDLGISQGVLNEALRLSQARGLVSIRRGPAGGVFAAVPTPTVRLGNSVLALDSADASVTDAVRLREALDPLTIEDAAAYATASHVEEMRLALDRMREAVSQDDDDAFFRANFELHARIGSVTPNVMLRSFYLGLLDIVASHTVQVSPRAEPHGSDYLAGRFELHVELVDAIASRDQSWVRDVAQRHATSTFTDPNAAADHV